MAAEVVGGAFLSASLQVLFDRLASEELIHFISGNKPIDRLLKDLKIKLLSSNIVLNDAEEKQIRNPPVKQWLDHLKEAIFDSEDLIAELRALAMEDSTTQPQVLLLKLFSHSDKALRFRLTEILDRLDFILKQRDPLGLKEGRVSSPSSSSFPRLSASLSDESVVYGRDSDKESVLKMLLSENGGDTRPDISVISVVGMGGIGKTTLAQIVYDDKRVAERFDSRAWVCVSDKFDVLKATRTVFEAVTSSPCEARDLHELQVKLRNALRGKKFLVVLDDVWNENYVHWDVLRSPFESGARGSKIVVTTRSETVASKVSDSVSVYRLRTISDEACLALFSKHAFDNGVLDIKARSILQVFGRMMVRKCKGLPLAVKSLGGLLRSVTDPEEWKKVLKSDIWELSERESDILPALWLSYRYLPPRLKRCFAYCAIFPKGYKVTKEKLIMLWMAEDLLRPAEGKRVEEVGDECFSELLSRSLFQKDHQSPSFFGMHDLVNELARFVSGEFCSRFGGNGGSGVSRRTRHLSYAKRHVDSVGKFEALFDAKCLRTFLPLGWNKETQPFPWNDSLLRDLLPKVPCLRVLSLSEYPITELPDSLGNLKHLRYLDLSWTKVESLPSTICALYYLETLILAHCKNLAHLPAKMGNLINLRYLDINCTGIKEMPSEIFKMRNLQALSSFVLGGDRGGSSIRQLRDLKQLCGHLCISGLQNVARVEDAVEANLRDKKFIRRLHLKWDWLGVDRHRIDDSQKERAILESLRPHRSLKELFVLSYRGTRFPDWVGDRCFSTLAVVSLSNCRNCCLLPPLGRLPALRKLDIRGFEALVRIGAEFYSDSPFRSLEVLRFGDMPEWREWSFVEPEAGLGPLFPNLKELYLRDCPELNRALPNHLPSLATLYVSRCHRLTGHRMDSSFPSLRSMEISNSPEFESSLESCSKLPSDLNELSIVNCETLFAGRGNWNLGRLRSLTCLRIRSMRGAGLGFPEEGLFPRTIVHLMVSNLPSLGALNGRGFRGLASLKQLWISSCSQLRSLPEGLPDSLTYLFISDCPLLNRRCLRERGEDWPKISHITRVRIDGELI